MSTPNYQTILYHVEEGVATVRLNRPERRNALTSEMLGELYTAVVGAANDPSVRGCLDRRRSHFLFRTRPQHIHGPVGRPRRA